MATIDTPTGGNGEKKTKIQELTGEKKSEISEILFGDKEAILKDLKEHHIKIEENAEMMGYKGKKVHINLPAVGNFEGFKFDYFVSEKFVNKNDFEKNPELENKSYSMKEVGELFKAINRFMAELGVKTDGDIDYLQDITWRGGKHKDSLAGNCLHLKEIAGLGGGPLWLSDYGYHSKKEGSHNVLVWWGDGNGNTVGCSCSRYDEESGNIEFEDNALFLKVSD